MKVPDGRNKIAWVNWWCDVCHIRIGGRPFIDSKDCPICRREMRILVEREIPTGYEKGGEKE